MIDDREREQIATVLDVIAQDEAAADLALQVQGGSITVTKIGTAFSSTYEKLPDNPHLVMTRGSDEPGKTTQAMFVFRARAFQAAVAKARELGWIA